MSEADQLINQKIYICEFKNKCRKSKILPKNYSMVKFLDDICHDIDYEHKLKRRSIAKNLRNKMRKFSFF